MRVLVIGSGAREHALVARLSADRDVGEILAVQGNPGIASLSRLLRGSVGDGDGPVDLAVRDQIDLTVVGPELPLSFGLVDRFTAEGLLAFGPTRGAAQLESSKAFRKNFTDGNAAPTARI